MIFARPPSSRASLLNFGQTAVSNWMMMVALIYGMMPSVPMAQRSSAPPANVFNRPSAPPPFCEWVCEIIVQRRAVQTRECGSRQSAGRPPARQSVNKMRDFSSGILAQLPNVLKMERNMNQSSVRPSTAGLRPATSQVPPLASILALADALNALAITVSFLVKSPVPRILMPSERPLDKADGAQRRFVHARAVVKLVQVGDIDRVVCRRETRVVETAFRDAADERHLAAFKTDDGWSCRNGPSGLCRRDRRFCRGRWIRPGRDAWCDVSSRDGV